MDIRTTRWRMLSAKLKEEDNSVLIATVIGTDGKEEKELRECHIQGKKGNRYIEFEDGKHVLIENEEQIDEKLDAKDYDFSYCIFLCDANFSGKKFSEKAYFEKAIFCGFVSFEAAEFKGAPCFRRAVFSGNANFGVCTFCRLADFWGATFNGDAYFLGVEFSGEADFTESKFSNVASFRRGKFSNEVRFEGGTFIKNVNFQESMFSGDAYFWNVNFGAEAIFEETEFSEKAYFSKDKFSGKVNFVGAKFSMTAYFVETEFGRDADFGLTTFSGGANFLRTSISDRIDFSHAKFDSVFNFQDVKAGKGFSLSLLGVEIENLWYMGSDIPRAESRETFLILKHQASKQQDTVRALEFYKKEMNLYREELKKDSKKADSWTDRIILWFEWHASKYGTAPVRAMVWLVGINAIYIVACIILFYVPGDIPLVGFISNYSFNPFSILSDLKIDTIQGWRAVLVVLNFLKNILSAVLAYEIIKSFRKYSRRL